MSWWTLQVVVVIVGVGTRAVTQETGPHSGPTAADRGYTAEWQWEQWPQQLMSDIKNVTRGPGPRMGSSLWFDSSASSWWLFGGHQSPSSSTKNTTKLKMYTDLWRYDTSARIWNRIFPNDKLKGNSGGMILLRTNLFNDGYTQKGRGTSSNNPGVVLCGRSEGKGLDERSLAVYGPRSSRSDTVWQLELKDRQWTAYVCCCDNTGRSTGQSARNNSAVPTGTVRHESNFTRNFTAIQITDDGCNDTKMNQNIKEDINNYSTTDNTEKNRKKSKDEDDNQSRILEDSLILECRESSTVVNNQEIYEEVDSRGILPTQSPITEKLVKDNNRLFNASVGRRLNNDSSVQNEGLGVGKQCLSDLEHENVGVPVNNVSSRTNFSDLGEDRNEDETVHTLGNRATHRINQRDVVPNKESRKQKPNLEVMSNDSFLNHAFCPDFDVGDNSNEGPRGQPVAWCDTNKELLVALDLKVIPLKLWQFDLRTSHWTQQKVNIEEGTLWPGCSSHIRYTSTGSTVYILCPPYGTTTATSTRLVYRIDPSNATLQASGQLQLNILFGNEGGDAIWTDETKTILQTVDTDYNRTLLFIAYDKLLDIWVLDRYNDRSYFVPVENIWRGSALKWFRGFDAPFYNLQMGGQSWLLPNPRQVTKYWPRERGRFIIRLIDPKENSSGASPIEEELHMIEMKNHSETSIPILQHHQTQDGIKALMFFALSISIFGIFGMAVFVRRCVTCPPQSWPLRGDDGSKATPPVIRYSVIPDDLAYPVA